MIAVPNISTAKAIEIDASLDTHRDVDHQRSVITIGGPPPILISSCVALAEWILSNLDITRANGVHPRFGTLDVLPLVPYSRDEAAVQQTAVELRVRLEAMGLPVQTYGRAHPDERSLPKLRRLLGTTPHKEHPTAGVVCLGIRDPLVAFNVNLQGDLKAARRVAKSVRGPDVRALGFELASRGLVQVSMNLIAPDRVGPKATFDRLMPLARDEGLELVDCEVVGLVPHPILEQLEGLPLRAPVRSIEQAFEEKGLR